MMNLKDTYAGVDPILTTLAQGFMLPETNIANFIAPVVDTPTRAGKILRFGKEAFAVDDYRRAYGANIPAVQSRFDSDAYSLNQEVIAWELAEETIENAGEGPAQVDLRAIETRNAMARLMNSYENTVAERVSTSSLYETGLYSAKNGNWLAASGANPVGDVIAAKRLVADQIGIRPNSMVIGSEVYDSLLTNESILDRIRYTSADSIDTDILARYFGLERGLRVAEGRKLAADGTLVPVFDPKAILLFYSPMGASDSVMPAGGASAATPAFAYTYQLTGTPAVRPEYYIRERRVVRAEITVERSVELTGLGATGKVGSGYYCADVLSA